MTVVSVHTIHVACLRRSRIVYYFFAQSLSVRKIYFSRFVNERMTGNNNVSRTGNNKALTESLTRSHVESLSQRCLYALLQPLSETLKTPVKGNDKDPAWKEYKRPGSSRKNQQGIQSSEDHHAICSPTVSFLFFSLILHLQRPSLLRLLGAGSKHRRHHHGPTRLPSLGRRSETIRRIRHSVRLRCLV